MPVFTKGDQAILFVHIPKTGGTSVEETFRASGWEISYRDFSVDPGSANWYRRCSPQHMHAELLEHTFRLDRFTGIFTLVREPLARFRSEYAMRTRSHERLDAAAVEAWSDSAFSAYETDSFVWDNHLRPQVEFLVPGAEIFHLEDGLEGLATYLRHRWSVDLTAPIARSLDRQIDTGFPSSAVEISPTLQMHLRSFYAEDFRAFGYGP